MFLNKNNSIDSVNENGSIKLGLFSNSDVIHGNDLRKKIDLLEEYNLERDYCYNNRVIINISPYMTNVLYNKRTEVVKNEGSDECINLIYKPIKRDIKKNISTVDPIDYLQAIRDTEYSNKELGNLTYHCGIDIFNNHRLRTKSFVNISIPSDEDRRDVFNTINDFQRDKDGKIIKEPIYYIKVNGDNSLDELEHCDTKRHIYMYEDIQDLYDAFNERKAEDNGWHGFKNPSFIETGSNKKEVKGQEAIKLNKLLNNNKPFEFIDFYPDRSLFSFLPKINKFRKREEYNWEYSIMYPYKTDKKEFNKLMFFFDNDHSEGEELINGIKAIDYKEIDHGSGTPFIQFRSLIRHNLKKGDSVRFMYRSVPDYTYFSGGFLTQDQYGKVMLEEGDSRKLSDLYKKEAIFVVKEGKNAGVSYKLFRAGENEYEFKKYDDDFNAIDRRIYVINHFVKNDKGEYEFIKENFIFLEKDGIFIKSEYGDFTQSPISAEVYDIGDIENGNIDKDHFFSVKKESVSHFMEMPGMDKIDKDISIIFNKIINGYPCEYYFRRFKKIKNLGPGGERNKEIKNENGRNAFSQTIFGDNSAQIIFNDPINTLDIVDNRGRNLTEIYFNIEKTNKGYEEWYSQEITGSKDIEFSHCFGKVTAGLDLPNYVTDFNVHKMHNIDLYSSDVSWEGERKKYEEETKRLFEGFLNPAPKSQTNIPESLEYNDKDDILGDIVEYSPKTDTETVIEEVYHRFNTAQRECVKNGKYFDLIYDKILNDDFGFKLEDGKYSKNETFSTEENNLALIDGEKYRAINLSPEGYYYKPLYKIDIRRKNNNILKSQGQLINCSWKDVCVKEYTKDKKTGLFVSLDSDSGKEIINNLKEGEDIIIKDCILVKSPFNYGFTIGSNFLLYDRKREKNFWGQLEEVEGDLNLLISFNVKNYRNSEGSFNIDGLPTKEGEKNRYNLIMANLDVPLYANYVNDSEQSFFWRETLKFSEVPPDDSISNVVFSNGCLYFEENIQFFLRRQDPFGKYGLLYVNKDKRINPMNNYVYEGNEYIPATIEYIDVKDNAICN